MTPTLSSFLIGLTLGAIASVIGGILSYFFGLRKVSGDTAAPLVLLFVTVLTLGLLGVIAIFLSLGSGNTLQALVTGVGVVTGFSITFALQLLLYLKIDTN